MRASKKKKVPPLSYREYREEFQGNNIKSPRSLGTFPNEDRDYEEKTEPSEGWKDRDKIFIGPDRVLFHEPLQHFPGVYPTSALSLRGLKYALKKKKEEPDEKVFFSMKRREPNKDNVDVYDTSNKNEIKAGPRYKGQELSYDPTPSTEKGVETEYERPFPWLEDAMSGVQRIMGPYF